MLTKGWECWGLFGNEELELVDGLGMGKHDGRMSFGWVGASFLIQL